MSELTDAQRKRAENTARAIHAVTCDTDPPGGSYEECPWREEHLASAEAANTAADETLHELLDKLSNASPQSKAHVIVDIVRAALMPRIKERSELGREKK